MNLYKKFDYFFFYLILFLDKVELECQPAVGVIPLGTGNDLARCLRWGGGYEGESIYKILHKIAKATPVMLDRWLIELSDTALPDPDQKIDTRIPYNIINNYFSVGVVSFFTLLRFNFFFNIFFLI